MHHLLPVLALTGSVAARVAMWPRGTEDVCRQQPYAEMQTFAYYAPAQSACWQQYPGPTYAVTVPPTTKTAYTTVTTATVTSVVNSCAAPIYYTTNSGVTSSPYTSTSSQSSSGSATTTATFTDNPISMTTVTTMPPPTPTPTGGVMKNKKRAEQMAAAWGAKWQSLQEYGDDSQHNACSCIQGTKTVTVTDGPVPTVTSTIETSAVVTASVC